MGILFRYFLLFLDFSGINHGIVLSNLYETGNIKKSKKMSKEVKVKKGMTFSVIFSVALLFIASSFAQSFRGMRKREGLMKQVPTRILFVLKAKQKELKITDHQLEKIENLVFSFEEKMIQMKSHSSLQRLELRKLLLDRENLDYEKIRAALSKASNSKQNIFIERLKMREEIQSMLTPEQREAMKAMRKDQLRKRRLFQRGDKLRRFLR